MSTLEDQGDRINDAQWRAWVQKSKLRDREAARKYGWIGGIAAAVIAAGIAFYLGAIR